MNEQLVGCISNLDANVALADTLWLGEKVLDDKDWKSGYNTAKRDAISIIVDLTEEGE